MRGVQLGEWRAGAFTACFVVIAVLAVLGPAPSEFRNITVAEAADAPPGDPPRKAVPPGPKDVPRTAEHPSPAPVAMTPGPAIITMPSVISVTEGLPEGVTISPPLPPGVPLPGMPVNTAPAAAAVAIAPADSRLEYIVRQDHWTHSDEKGYGDFIRLIGESNCHTVNNCIKGPGNPFRGSDPSYLYWRADCADLPYFLRAYYAWKRGLPFAYESSVAPVGHSRDMRYSRSGNEVLERHVVTTGSTTGPALLAATRDTISSAMYRMHPTRETPIPPDHYPVALNLKGIRPGTVIYDPNGHLAVVYKIESDGRIRYIDAHPDNSVTHGTYDQRFVRARPGMGSGFKNWRPIQLIGATRDASGVLHGGTIAAAKNSDLPDYSTEQFYGNAHEKPGDDNWSRGAFRLGKETLDYYDYVRAQMAGGSLHWDPVVEVRNMVRSNCDDLHYRADAVNLAIEAGLQNRGHPDALPINIYGTEGDWETFSTPSRDARLKTAFKELRDQVERFVRLHAVRDPKIVYRGDDLVRDLIRTYDRETAACRVSYVRSDRSVVTMTYEAARERLFRISFDPYNCIELRWGAEGAEGSTCTDAYGKRQWYAAEQNLRNQLERTYEARMDHTLAELREPGGDGKGVPVAPDTDVRGFLARVRDHGLPMASAAPAHAPPAVAAPQP